MINVDRRDEPQAGAPRRASWHLTRPACRAKQVPGSTPVPRAGTLASSWLLQSSAKTGDRSRRD